MVKISRLICIDDDIVYDTKFQSLIKERAVSSVVNNLLRVHLKIINTDKNILEDELKTKLMQIEAEKIDIEKNLAEIEAKKPKLTKQEIADGWFIDEEGVKWQIQK